MALIHLFQDPTLLDRVREQTRAARLASERPLEADLNQHDLTCMPLLQSIYAETLRLHTNAYTIVGSDVDMTFGRWRFPKGGLGLISPEICHTDEKFWNTRGGLHPVQSFWAERFITDPSDPASGPIRPGLPEKPPVRRNKAGDGDEVNPYVTMEGLEGAWIPYSGKLHPTPLLANNTWFALTDS